MLFFSVRKKTQKYSRRKKERKSAKTITFYWFNTFFLWFLHAKTHATIKIKKSLSIFGFTQCHDGVRLKCADDNNWNTLNRTMNILQLFCMRNKKKKQTLFIAWEFIGRLPRNKYSNQLHIYGKMKKNKPFIIEADKNRRAAT